LAFKVIDEWQKEALTDATKWIINYGLRSRKIKE
jgi:3-methyladenine DNA glycosylase AlkC